jgi:hypothetical protein
MTTPDWTELADLVLTRTLDGRLIWHHAPGRPDGDEFFTPIEDVADMLDFRTHLHLIDRGRGFVRLRLYVDPGITRGTSGDMKRPDLLNAVRTSAVNRKAAEEELLRSQLIATLSAEPTSPAP